MTNTTVQQVAAAAWRIRRYALRMGEVQGQGYIGQALGYADVLATAFAHGMTFQGSGAGVGRPRPLPALPRTLRHCVLLRR